jgi:DNA-binding IclR family transcriptional regulator
MGADLGLELPYAATGAFYGRHMFFIEGICGSAYIVSHRTRWICPTVSTRVADTQDRPAPIAHTHASAVTRVGPLGKPVGAVTAAADVLRALHTALRPLNASEVARVAGLHRGTAYNILRTLQAESLVSYDETSRTYSVSLHILELAHGALRRSGLLDIARPLMQAVADAQRVSVYLSKVLGPSSLLLLDWVGGVRPDPYVTIGRPHPSPTGASGIVLGAFGSSNEPQLEALLSEVEWYQKPSFREFLTRVKKAKETGFAVDRGTLFQGVTLVSVPVLSPSWELLLILTAAGHSHDLEDDAVGALSRALQSAAVRLSDSLPLLRLG